MRRGTLLAALVLLAEVTFGASRQPTPWGTNDFVVASYNIRRAGDKGDNEWSQRLPRIAGVIESHGFDLIGFQEVYPEQLADLKRVLPGWAAFGRGRSANHTDEASPIFWKRSRFTLLDSGEFWHSPTPDKPGSKAWKAMFPRICTWVKLRELATGRVLFHFNTHLDHASVEARHNSAILLLERIAAIAGDEQVLLTGDFNDEIGTAEYRAEVKARDHTVLSPEGPDHPLNIIMSRLFDARERSATEPMGTEWSDNGYGQKHVKRIDYIFVSKRLAVRSYETCADRPGGKYPSDHEAVTAKLQFAPDSTFVFDLGGMDEYAEWATNRLMPAVERFYPEVCARLAQPRFHPPRTVRVCLRNEPGEAPAWTAGGEVTLNMDWARSNREEAIGAVIHELAHVVQAYRDVNHPDWLTEGIADYIRWMIFEPPEVRNRVIFESADQPADGSYRSTAAFLYWMEQKYDRDFVMKLNAVCRTRRYRDSFWTKVFGKDLKALEEEWHRSFADGVQQQFKSADGRYSFEVDCSAAPELAGWARTRLQPVLSEWYGRLADDFAAPGYQPRTKVSYRLCHEMKNPGVASGSTVRLSIEWIRKHRENVKLGMVIHETWHLLQRYRSKAPTWLTEGVADWVRYFHYERRAPKINAKKARADGSYGETATFLDWCCRWYGADFVRNLIAALRQGKYDDGWWKSQTGRSFDELAADWKSSLK